MQLFGLSSVTETDGRMDGLNERASMIPEMIMRKLYIKRRITRKLSLQFSKHEQEIENDNRKVVYIANDNERVVDFKGKKELFSSPEPVKITGKAGD